MARKTKAEREAQREADRMFLESCLEALDDGEDITVVVPSRRDARRMRSAMTGREAAALRIVVGDPDALLAAPRPDDKETDRP